MVGWNGDANEDFTRKLRTLRALCQDIVELRRGDHSSGRLNIEQERLNREREKTDEEVAEHFKRWAQNPAVREWICKNWVCPEEKDRRIREILQPAVEGIRCINTWKHRNSSKSNQNRLNQSESNHKKCRL